MSIFKPSVVDFKASSDLKLAIVVSRFNGDITDKLLEGALLRAAECGFSNDQIDVVHVPGVVEIPLITKTFAKTQKYDAIVCLGAVIRGETSHYDYVCKQVSDGCQQVALAYDLPVIFGILTTENMKQALERVGGQHGHKGVEAMDAACEMITLMRELS